LSKYFKYEDMIFMYPHLIYDCRPIYTAINYFSQTGTKPIVG